MKRQLSCCEIEQLSDDIFEMTATEGITFDDSHIKQISSFIFDSIKKPFKLLVSDKNSFRISFSGSIETGRTNRVKKMAILNSCSKRKVRIDMALDIKKNEGDLFESKVFSDKEKALNWLSAI